ncbi:hypothetical protein QTN47_22570 [Danxiaibacter flavus]|uniref:Peptidase S74 domain-containing protein n=1 Tax=Danxiaibacter flavus TaxID=3049108 RepID=A0ABV3ZK99_9BACT|nr:hypothetical protein QNM32_22575 [Chitinophagaceae bacterium DXS]
MRKIITTSLFILASLMLRAQQSGSFIVKGDLDKFYPVTFSDGNFWTNIATEVEIGRSDVHRDGSWRGSLISKFRYHTNNWGQGANFVDADIRNNIGAVAINNFIAGWKDVTSANGDAKIIIWLRGGTNTYYYKGNANISPVVFDGVQNLLPYQETNGPTYSYKTAVDSYVNTNGATLGNNLYVTGPSALNGTTTVKGVITSDVTGVDIGGTLSLKNPAKTAAGSASEWKIYNMSGIYGNSLQFWAYDNISCAPGGMCTNRFTLMDNGNVGIGSIKPTEKLSVNGTVLAKKVRVSQAASDWPDYVFDSSYNLPSLDAVSSFIRDNKHLPEMPSVSVVEKEGHDLGEVQKLLLKKVEELTLYVIKQDDKIKALSQQNALMEAKIKQMETTK